MIDVILTILGFAVLFFIVLVFTVLILVRRDKDLYGDINQFNDKI